jgi:hypothetical protein
MDDKARFGQDARKSSRVVPEPSCTRRTSTSFVHRSTRMRRTKGAAAPDRSSPCGMPGATRGPEP